MKSFHRYARLGAVLVVPAVIVACSDTKDSNTGSSGAGIVVTPVSGDAVDHCKASDGTETVVTVDPNACTASTGTMSGNVSIKHAGHDGGEPDAAADVDASADVDGGTVEHEEAHEVLTGSSGNDDDCKYRVEWTSAAGEGESETIFTVKLTSLADGKPVTGADPNVEAFLTDTHPAPNSDQKATETEPGVYTVGPVAFDDAGKWTVRFHFFEECSDSEASPHGHIGFYVNVP